jgi:ProP effector
MTRRLKNENPGATRPPPPGQFQSDRGQDRSVPTTTLISSVDSSSPAALVTLFEERWPRTFRRLGKERRPLALGIHLKVIKAIAGAAPTEAEARAISRAVEIYVANEFYLKACVAGAARVDLDGKAAGSVTESEAGYARAVLMWRRHDQAAEEVRKRNVPLRRTEPDDAYEPDGLWTQEPHAANAGKARLTLAGRRA